MTELTEHHRFVLAIVAAHQEMHGCATPLRVLLGYVASSAGQPHNPFSKRQLPNALMASLGELTDNAALVVTADGLALPVDAEDAA